MNSTITTAAVTMRYSITFIDEMFASAAQYNGKKPYTTSATTIAVTPCGVLHHPAAARRRPITPARAARRSTRSNTVTHTLIRLAHRMMITRHR